nr:hypothetical protein [Tanacetum cinerariifolium]
MAASGATPRRSLPSISAKCEVRVVARSSASRFDGRAHQTPREAELRATTRPA